MAQEYHNVAAARSLFLKPAGCLTQKRFPTHSVLAHVLPSLLAGATPQRAYDFSFARQAEQQLNKQGWKPSLIADTPSIEELTKLTFAGDSGDECFLIG